jgi:exodeoxyribonuclease III
VWSWKNVATIATFLKSVSGIMKVATWNVNGIRARHAQVVEWIEREKPEIVCLQEIKASPDQIPMELCDLQGYWCYWHGFKGYSGVGLHIRKDFSPEKPQFLHPDFDHESRVVIAKLSSLAVGSVYVPNGGKDFDAKLRFLEALERYSNSMHLTGVPLILCGDLNVARTDMDVHPKERKPNIIGQRPEERELLEKIIGNDLVDVGRAMDPQNDQLFTWWAPWRNMRQRNIGWRLDYILASKNIAQVTRDCTVLASVGTSDHAPLIANFECTS